MVIVRRGVILVKKKKVEDKLVVYLEGRLDVTVATEIEEDLTKVIDDDGEIHLILNLENVEYMSSSGFRACIAILRKLKQREGSLKLCAIRPSVKRIFDVIELTSLFDIYETEQDALAA